LRNDAACRAKELHIIEGKQIAIDYHCDPCDSRYPEDKALSKSPDKNGDLVYAHRPQIIWDSMTPSSTSHIVKAGPVLPLHYTGFVRTIFSKSLTWMPSKRSTPIPNTPAKSS